MSTSNQKYIISEYYDFNIDENLIREAEEKNKPIIMTGILQMANTENKNGRVYSYEVLKREADKYMESVKDNRAGGELDHPDSAVVSLSNVSHRVTEMWWEGETLYGKVQLAATPAGDILKGLLKSGFKLGISSRGIGSVKKEGGKDVVQDDFELIAFDFVSSPSTPGAYLFKESKQWGLTKLTHDATRLIKASNTQKSDVDKYEELVNISENDFWKI